MPHTQKQNQGFGLKKEKIHYLKHTTQRFLGGSVKFDPENWCPLLRYIEE
jgi:hypothetical protein